MNKNERYGDPALDRAAIVFVISIYILFFSLSIYGCKSTKQTQADKDYNASIAHEKLIAETRAKFPCDTSTVIVTKTDTAIIFLSDTSYSHDTTFITKRKVVTNTVYMTATVVDSAYGQLWKDRYDQAGYLLQISREQSDKIAMQNTIKDVQIETLKPWRVRAVITWIIMGLATVALLYLKFKP